ncbi:phosphatidylinositol-4-phosphate 5-kinase-domain-containing protein [Entophlyctis helioformis]|nr:phosphatidylinositol-4-phosphate 5-kinase-domain-containing protein [Entophlyctis helioformis]
MNPIAALPSAIAASPLLLLVVSVVVSITVLIPLAFMLFRPIANLLTGYSALSSPESATPTGLEAGLTAQCICGADASTEAATPDAAHHGAHLATTASGHTTHAEGCPAAAPASAASAAKKAADMPEDPAVTAFRICVYAVLHAQEFNPETLPADSIAWPSIFRRALAGEPAAASAVSAASTDDRRLLSSAQPQPQSLASSLAPTAPAVGAVTATKASGGPTAATPLMANPSAGALLPPDSETIAGPSQALRAAAVVGYGATSTTDPSTSPAHTAAAVTATSAAAPTPRPAAAATVASRSSVRTSRFWPISWKSATAPQAAASAASPSSARSTSSSSSSSSSGRQALNNLQRHHFTAEHHHEWTIPDYGHVKFTDHCPVAFAAVREVFAYDLDDLKDDLSAALLFSMTEGKSDAAFMRTKSGRFLFKTLRGSEPDNLKSFLPAYLPFIASNRDTLLPRYLGLYTIETVNRRSAVFSTSVMASSASASGSDRDRDAYAGNSMANSGYGGQGSIGNPTAQAAFNGKVHIVLMANVFDTRLPIHRKFDFKGSTVGREALKPNDLLDLFLSSSSSSASSSAESTASSSASSGGVLAAGSVLAANSQLANRSDLTLKELDYNRLLIEGLVDQISIGDVQKAWLLQRLVKDTNLLKQHGFMDYSLLVGVHTRQRVLPPPAPVNHPSTASVSFTAAAAALRASVVFMNMMTSNGSSAGSTAGTTEKPPQPLSTRMSRESLASSFASGSHGGQPGGRPVFESTSTISSAANAGHSHDATHHGSSDANTAVVDILDGAPVPPVHHDILPPLTSDSLLKPTDPNAPAHRNVHGGMSSLVPLSEEVDYEIYYFGLIDALQKYNVMKWVERNVKKQTSQMLTAPVALTSIFSASSASLATGSPSYNRGVGLTTPPISPTPSSALSPPTSSTLAAGAGSGLVLSPLSDRADAPALGVGRSLTHKRSRSLTALGRFQLRRPTVSGGSMSASDSSRFPDIDLQKTDSAPAADGSDHRGLDSSDDDRGPASPTTVLSPRQAFSSFLFPPAGSVAGGPPPPPPPPPPENSVEEPVRYASRLVKYIDSIVS